MAPKKKAKATKKKTAKKKTAKKKPAKKKPPKKKPAKKKPAKKKPAKKKPAKKKPAKKTKKKAASLAIKGKISPFFQLHPTYSAGAMKLAPEQSGRGKWVQIGSLNQHRFYHKAILLKDGKVMVVGGQGPDFLLETAEVLDRTTGRWTPVQSMQRYRVAHSTLLLKSGKVLVAGGVFEKGCEVYDPSSGKWITGQDMPDPRWSHGDVVLEDGRALLFGGFMNYDSKKQMPMSSALLFNPKSTSWKKATRLPYPVGNPTVTMLLNGQVLLAGGRDVSEAGIPRFSRSSAVYNPKADKYKLLGNMRVPRSLHTTTLLADGRVLVTGGENKKGVQNTAEVLDPKSGKWRKLPPMQERRRSHTATLLMDGKVLVVGGENQRGSLQSVEIYDPKKKTWTELSYMRKPRACHTATLLPDGGVLIAGGRRSPNKESATRDTIIWRPFNSPQ